MKASGGGRFAGSWREILRRRGKLYAGLAATWLLLPLMLAHGLWEWRESAGFGYNKIAPLSYGLTQPGVVAHYLRLAFWPHPLCLDYGWPVARLHGTVRGLRPQSGDQP